MSLRSASGTIARKRACNTVLDGTAATLQRTHTSYPSDYLSLSLTVTGKQLRRSDWKAVDRNGGKTAHRPIGTGKPNELMDGKNTAGLRRGMCRRHRYGKLDHRGKKISYGPRIHDRHGPRGTKVQRNKGPLYRKLWTTATWTPDARYSYDGRARLHGRDLFSSLLDAPPAARRLLSTDAVPRSSPAVLLF